MQAITVLFEGTFNPCALFQIAAVPASSVRSSGTERLPCPVQLLIFDFPALPPTMQQTSTAQQELKLARETSSTASFFLRSDCSVSRSHDCRCVSFLQGMCWSSQCCPA